MNIQDLIATEYLIPESFYGRRFTIQRRGENNLTRWAVCDSGFVLNKKLEFEYEPSPSNRNHEFLKRTRFETVQEALDAFSAWFVKQPQHP